MQIIPVTTEENTIKVKELDVNTTTFAELNLKESNVEEFIRCNIDLLFEDEESLLIIGQQVSNQQKGISDLIAIDQDGSIVLIEIKRDKSDIITRKEAFEFQAIRYAASCAKIISPEDLVEKIFSRYIEKHPDERKKDDRTPSEIGQERLNGFLTDNNAIESFNKKQRIILIASDYDSQTESAVAWLISNGIDISSFKLIPLKIGSDCFLQLEKVLPIPILDDFYVDFKSNTTKTNKSKGIKRTNLPRMKKLLDWGVICKDEKIDIKNSDYSEATIIDETYVLFKNEKMRYNEWGKFVKDWSSICIYEWAINKEGQTLHDLRMSKIEEINSKNVNEE